jgi:hypothetical protein
VSVFSLDHFKRFCSHLHIDSKERGQIPFKWIGTQTYAMDEIAKGLEQGIHTFFILKGRQLGISTVSIALDLYWMYMHNGLQGALVTDTDDNRDLFKSYLTQYQESLPSRARVQVAQHNRTQLVLKNRSRLSYIVAGKRKNESLGAGKAVNFMHGTECASWGDQDGMGSLVATLAQQNPKRLYVFESTAFGYNMWYELCEQAKDATSERSSSSAGGGTSSTARSARRWSSARTGMASPRPTSASGCTRFSSSTSTTCSPSSSRGGAGISRRRCRGARST